jgi:hypothetical protein
MARISSWRISSRWARTKHDETSGCFETESYGATGSTRSSGATGNVEDSSWCVPLVVEIAVAPMMSAMMLRRRGALLRQHARNVIPAIQSPHFQCPLCTSACASRFRSSSVRHAARDSLPRAGVTIAATRGRLVAIADDAQHRIQLASDQRSDERAEHLPQLLLESVSEISDRRRLLASATLLHAVSSSVACRRPSVIG